MLVSIILFCWFSAVVQPAQTKRNYRLPDSVINQLVNSQPNNFENFKLRFRKKYSNPSEELYRNMVMYRNTKKVIAHNIQ